MKPTIAPDKIFIIGNAAGGKTRLARHLSKVYKLPVTHVDSIQFLPGMKIRPLEETRLVLKAVIDQPRWIIDGYGPLDLLEQRFTLADQIIFIDLPFARHLWWFLKRQVENIFSRRSELPDGCNEVSLQHSIKVIKTMWKMHKQMQPELRRILGRENLRAKVIHIRSRIQLVQF